MKKTTAIIILLTSIIILFPIIKSASDMGSQIKANRAAQLEEIFNE